VPGVQPLIHVDPEEFPLVPMECLRCGTEAPMRFAGTCTACTAELREKFQAAEGRVVDTEYVPKVNVTANAIATKD
jgi:hypothetical protein